MFVVNPTAILYDAAGIALAVSPGVTIPVGTSTLLAAGTDGTNARVLSTDTTGRLNTTLPPDAATESTLSTLNSVVSAYTTNQIPAALGSQLLAQSFSVVDATQPTYTASSPEPFVLQNGPRDVFEIARPGTRNRICVTRMWFSARKEDGPKNIPVRLVKRKANDRGDGFLLTNVPYDSGDTPTAVVQTFGADPAEGAEIGTVWSGFVFIPSSISDTQVNQTFMWEWTPAKGTRPISLAGEESLCINLLGSADARGLTAFFGVEWYEVE